MFQKKLLAFVSDSVCARWIEVWIGDSLSQLKTDLDYFVSFYGFDNLRVTSEYVYKSFDDFIDDDFFDDDLYD